MREKDIEAKVKKYAEAKSCLFYKFTSPGRRGVPDRLIIAPNGTPGMLELKAPGNEPTPLQLIELRKLRERNVMASWADSFYAACAFVDNLVKADAEKHEDLLQD